MNSYLRRRLDLGARLEERRQPLQRLHHHEELREQVEKLPSVVCWPQRLRQRVLKGGWGNRGCYALFFIILGDALAFSSPGISDHV